MAKTKKYTISRQKKEEIIKTISTYLLQHNEIYAAYIFGSFLTEKTFADIDIGILLQHEVEDLLEYEIKLESKLKNLVKFDLDIRVLNRAPVTFSQNVIRHGQVIINPDPNRRADYECLVLKKYFDFARFRRRYLAEVINAPL